MKDSSMQITIVLDRSGSMASVADATISGFNEFVEAQKQIPGEVTLTLIQFDSENSYEVVFDRPVAEVPQLTAASYIPRGGTPLHDALGQTITNLGAKLKRKPEAERPSKIVIVTMTDGLENSSRAYNAPQIAEMIKHQREVYKWEFLFLGANQDAILTGEHLNIPAANAISYTAKTIGTANVMRATISKVQSYGITGQSRSLAYTPEERKDAMEDEETKAQP